MIVDKNIDNGNPFDWGKTSEEYAKYRDIYPEEFYNRIIELDCCIKGQHVLDIATGTGVLPRNLSKYGASFKGIDISKEQIEWAKILTEKANLNIEYELCAAEKINYPSETFDVVTACQCFWYFDKEVVIPKIHNILKNDGNFVVMVMSWIPNESEIAKRSEELVLKYNPSWTGANWDRKPIIDTNWIGNLFEIKDNIVFDVNVKFTREGWHGRIKASRGIGASSLSRDQILDWEREHFEYIKTLPSEFEIVHYCTILNVRKIN